MLYLWFLPNNKKVAMYRMFQRMRTERKRQKEGMKKTKKEELGFISLKKVILLSCWRPGSPAFAFTLGKELQRD